MGRGRVSTTTFSLRERRPRAGRDYVSRVPDEPMPLLPPPARDLLHLLDEAGRAAMAHFSPSVHVTRKADGSPVTAADVAAEQVLLAGIRALYPEDRALSEEGGAIGSASSLAEGEGCWVIDPLDGTSAFTEGLAHWGPTLARLERRGEGLVVTTGATWLPRLGEYWWVGAHAGRQVAVHADAPGAVRVLSPLATPPRAVVYVPSELHATARLRWRGKARCLGGTAAHLALVARGSAGAVVVGPGWSSWDVAAGLGLIVGTGGVVWPIGADQPLESAGTEEGARAVLPPSGAPFVAGHPDVVAEVAAVLVPERFTAGEVDAT